MTTWLMELPPSERQLLARAGGYAVQAKHGADPDNPAARARAGKRAKRLREIDPDERLSPAERERLLTLAVRQEMMVRAQQAVAARRARASERRGRAA